MYVCPIRYRNKVYKGKSNSKRVLFIKKSLQATNQKHQQNIHLKIHCEAETQQQQQQQQQLKLKSANCCKKRIQRLHPINNNIAGIMKK